tara:strand:+ start:1525 stop:2349 length:825 start_codon:yes stop_codon:yes gene_type:complete
MSTINLVELKNKIEGSRKAIRVESVKKLLGLSNTQFDRLRETGILNFTSSTLSVNGISIKFNQFAHTLNVYLKINRTYGQSKAYGELTNVPYLEIEQNYNNLDQDFLYGLALTYALNGLTECHKYAEAYFNCLKGKNTLLRAQELNLSLEEYEQLKSLGKIDWDIDRAYDVKTVSQSIGSDHTWRVNGKEYSLSGVSLYWSSPEQISSDYAGSDHEFIRAVKALYHYYGESQSSRTIPPAPVSDKELAHNALMNEIRKETAFYEKQKRADMHYD